MKMDGALDDCGVTDGEQPGACSSSALAAQLEARVVHAACGRQCTASSSIRAAKASELGDVPRRVSCGFVDSEMLLYHVFTARA